MKKLGLIILGSFMLLSSVTLSCPDKKFHNSTIELIQAVNVAIKVDIDTIKVDELMLVKVIMIAFPDNEEKQLKMHNDIHGILREYCKHHSLKFEII